MFSRRRKVNDLGIGMLINYIYHHILPTNPIKFFKPGLFRRESNWISLCKVQEYKKLKKKKKQRKLKYKRYFKK